MKKFLPLVICAACLLVACSEAATPTPEPSPTVTIQAFPTSAPTIAPVPPTILATPARTSPANTPAALNTALATVIVTPVRLPTSATTPSLVPPTPSAVGNALRKTQTAKIFRVSLTANVKSGNTPFALNLKGEIAGSDSHYAYQLGNEQIELTTQQGKYFVKGARSLGLPTTTKWYIVTPDLADAARPPFTPDDVLDDFTQQAGAAIYASTTREQLDGLNCQVWRATPKNFNETGIGNLLGGGLETSPFGVLDSSEVKLWVCDDGILHQLSIQVEAHNSKRATEKGSAQLTLRLQDFENSAIKIAAPTGAEPFQLRMPTP